MLFLVCSTKREYRSYIWLIITCFIDQVESTVSNKDAQEGNIAQSLYFIDNPAVTESIITSKIS